jgi:hypothetical protein
MYNRTGSSQRGIFVKTSGSAVFGKIAAPAGPAGPLGPVGPTRPDEACELRSSTAIANKMIPIAMRSLLPLAIKELLLAPLTLYIMKSKAPTPPRTSDAIVKSFEVFILLSQYLKILRYDGARENTRTTKNKSSRRNLGLH